MWSRFLNWPSACLFCPSEPSDTGVFVPIGIWDFQAYKGSDDKKVFG